MWPVGVFLMNPLSGSIKWKLPNGVKKYIPGMGKETRSPFWKREWNKSRKGRAPSENDTKLMTDMRLEARRPSNCNILSLRSQTITIHSAVGTALCLSVLSQVQEWYGVFHLGLRTPPHPPPLRNGSWKLINSFNASRIKSAQGFTLQKKST